VGGWTLEAAEQVCLAAGALELDMLEGLSSLLDKSLLRQEHSSNGEVRFRMLYVLGEFGREQLDAAREGTTTREAHAAYYLALAEEAQPQLHGAEQKRWQDRLAQEHDNLRAALNWWLEHAEQAHALAAAERALRLWWSLSQFWFNPSCYRKGYANVKRVLAVRAGMAEAVQVKALVYAAAVLRSADEVEQAQALVQEALALARQTEDRPSIVFALLNLGGIVVLHDQYRVAQASFEEAAALAQQMGDAWNTGIAQKNLVDVLLILGEYERAQMLAEACLAIFRAQGALQHIGESLTRLGWILFVARGDIARATSLVEQGLALVRREGHMSSTGWALFVLGVMRHHQGQFVEARNLLEASLVSGTGQSEPRDLFQRQTRLARLLAQQGDLVGARALYQQNRAFLPISGYKYLIADYLEGRGTLEAALGVPDAAALLWGAAEALREVIGAPMYPVDRDDYAQAIAAARAHMGETAFAAAWAEGRALSPEAALATGDEQSLARAARR